MTIDAHGNKHDSKGLFAGRILGEPSKSLGAAWEAYEAAKQTILEVERDEMQYDLYRSFPHLTEIQFGMYEPYGDGYLAPEFYKVVGHDGTDHSEDLDLCDRIEESILAMSSDVTRQQIRDEPRNHPWSEPVVTDGVETGAYAVTYKRPERSCARCGDPIGDHTVADPHGAPETLLCDAGPEAQVFADIDDSKYQHEQMTGAPYRATPSGAVIRNYFNGTADLSTTLKKRTMYAFLEHDAATNPDMTPEQKAIMIREAAKLRALVDDTAD